MATYADESTVYRDERMDRYFSGIRSVSLLCTIEQQTAKQRTAKQRPIGSRAFECNTDVACSRGRPPST